MDVQNEVQASVRRYVIHDNFCEVLAEAGAKKGMTYEWKEVIMLFIRYLVRRKPSLLDPQDSGRVICKDDPLGRIFGVDQFTKDETKLLVRQQVSLVNDDAAVAQAVAAVAAMRPSPASTDALKRAADDSSDSDAEAASKRGCPLSQRSAVPAMSGASTSGVSPSVAGGVARAGPSAAPSASGEPAAVRAAEAVSAAATSAGLVTHHAVSEDDSDTFKRTYALELEPVDTTEHDDSDSSGYSNMESPLQMTVLATWADDLGTMGDMETSCSDSDARDTWQCSRQDCHHANSAKRSRCDRCYTTRPAWVVERRRKTRRQRGLQRSNSILSRSDSLASPAPSADTQADGSQGSQPDSEPGCRVCVICFDRTRTAAIIHGKTGCNVTCYQCARRLWKQRDRCPSCRRTIHQVVHLKSD